MKILLIGEYSNVHTTLAKGLRSLGHVVTVVSNGDFWKDYPRDIDVSRGNGKLSGCRLLIKIISLLPQLRGYDIVQLINPLFFELKAKTIAPLYHYLRKHNGKIVLGAFGMDYYWVYENLIHKPLRYSDFNIGDTLREDPEATRYINDWVGTDKEMLNKQIADDCDAIVAGLYEYWAIYHPVFTDKTTFIPFPIEPKGHYTENRHLSPIRIFIGINKQRDKYKGTDIMLRAAQAIAAKYHDKVRLCVAESLPFGEYVEALRNADVLLDQLYSYTPAMNALEAMSRGIVVVGGGEPENYSLLNENALRPIINVEPSYSSVYSQLENLVLHMEDIPTLKRQSVEYIVRHHDYVNVARQYLRLYDSLMEH